MEDTKIQWATHTFNPWIGCAKVHAGCLNCYAEELMADRYKRVTWGPNGTRKLTTPNNWREPRKWNKAAAIAHAERIGPTERPRVFCASLADIFEDWQGPMIGVEGQPVTMDQARAALFKLIDETPYLDWIILTKRPENIRRMWPAVTVNSHEQAEDRNERGELYRRNVWLLTSVSNQETADRQAPELLNCCDLAPVLGLSAEPLLGHINLRASWLGRLGGGQLRWVIAGGESGADARPCGVGWINSLRLQCSAAGVPLFVKQLGAAPLLAGPRFPQKLKDPKGGDCDEWPEELRVRQFPRVAHG